MTRVRISASALATSVVVCLAIVQAKEPPKHEEQERKVQESEVPKAALDALRKAAAGNKLTEFSEEIEHGVTYYEGSWKSPNGNVDCLVTTAGDIVEIEEVIPADAAPKSVMDKARSRAGKDASLFVEKKTVILYEVKYRKDGKRHEVVYSPDGREREHEEESGNGDQDD